MTCRRDHRLSNPHGIDLADGDWHAVYIHKASDGRVLYVGCTKSLLTRTSGHRSGSAWHAYIAEIVVDSLWPDRESGMARERVLIQQLRPLANSHHNADRRPPRETAFQSLVRLLGSVEAANDAIATCTANEALAAVLYGEPVPA